MQDFLIEAGITQEVKRVFQLQKANTLRVAASTHSERIDKLKRLKSKIFEFENEIQEAIFADYRRHEVEAVLGEIYPTIGDLNHTIKNLRKWMRPQAIDTPLSYLGTSAQVRYEPKGVTLIMAPWNYPFSLLIRPLVAAIAAGNTAILKPSEMTPHVSAVINKMIPQLFDESEVAVFEGDASMAQALLDLPFNHICFTGSPAVGKVVMAAAAKHLASVTLELGGKSPHVVDANADIKKAAAQIAWGKCLNNGQTCIAPDYLLVHKSIKNELMELIGQQVEHMYNSDGKGVEASPYFCRIVNQRHFQRLAGYIEDALDKGAKIVYGGKTDAVQRYVSPTLITEVNDDMKLMQDEIFGPILPVKEFDDLEEVIRYINSKEKPLAMYIHSKSESNIERLIQNTSAGATVINDSIIHNTHPSLPFGGVNNSGIGKMNGFYGFQEFSNPRAILRQRFGTFAMIYPPYTDKVKKIVGFLTKYL